MTLCRATLFSLLFLAVAACQVAAPPPEMPELTFSNLPPITINVASIETEDAYTAPDDASYVEGTFPIVPEEALRRWVDERLKAGGNAYYVRVTLDEASIRKADLPRRKGMSGLFYDEQSERYDAVLKVRMRLIGEEPFKPLASVDVEVQRSQSFAEGLTLNERHEKMLDLVESVMNDFNKEAERQLRAHFSRYLM